MDELGGAVFSNDRTRRYSLWRMWDNALPTILFIMLNPSIADEKRLDPTVRRCYNYAKRWGYGRMLVGNLYPVVSTDPKSVNFKFYDPVNVECLVAMYNTSKKVICAWGSNANQKIAQDIRYILGTEKLYHLGLNKNGSPKHPLYLRNDVTPQPWMK